MNCSQLYVGAARRLREGDSEFIGVKRLGGPDEDYKPVASVLKLPHLYYLRSHAGCGCGWEYLKVDTEWDQRNLASLKALETYLREEVKSGPVLLLSSCVDSLGEAPPARDLRRIDELFAEFDGWRVPFGTNHARVAEVSA